MKPGERIWHAMGDRNYHAIRMDNGWCAWLQYRCGHFCGWGYGGSCCLCSVGSAGGRGCPECNYRAKVMP